MVEEHVSLPWNSIRGQAQEIVQIELIHSKTGRLLISEITFRIQLYDYCMWITSVASSNKSFENYLIELQLKDDRKRERVIACMDYSALLESKPVISSSRPHFSIL